MNIAFVSSEVVPFSKTGGLADVAGALPSEIAELGHKVAVFSPYYRSAKKVDPKAKIIAEGAVPVGVDLVPWTLHASTQNKGNAKYYFIGGDQYFDREGLYGTAQGDYEDSCSRFVFFCRACLAAGQALGEAFDVWHCNDWQTALIPAYLKFTLNAHPFFAKAASVMSIHNLAYQGLFWHWDWPLLNLAWQHFSWKELEFHGKINLLKGGIVHADLLTTVSPTYAQEIQTQEFGFGLEGALRDRRNELVGIVNGIETKLWNPATDSLIPATYSAENLEHKRACRDALRRRFELSSEGNPPPAVVGMIGRLFEQKGFDLVAQSIEELLRRNIQLVILGTGREEFHRLLQRVQQAHPTRVGVAFAFDNALAHLIEAGSDLFLMPSRYEPCGLNQLYSLAYGTPPVVRRVGGLADTVTNTTPETLNNGTATGFSFNAYNTQSMMEAFDRSMKIFFETPEVWRKIQINGMKQDWSWRRSAEKYCEVYDRAIQKAASRRK